ncbi:MAG: hypothetical protein J0I17_05330 ['Candidatus Kapabacteria' thiocyanatum]|uniref:Uncharacterized protein n=1 Tax=Candidatus Kapaibacterium thiocyanatum TaxID=1895771 RepID=A0A1M3L599_9BACT|nr:hypothetical protein ['Candidatus Kapabacteria' thiocyanatum]OJX60732.1 MAG: hypothetical protein BGO89_03945 ['Candidatus Kapabacteria' thiocyanatum]
MPHRTVLGIVVSYLSLCAIVLILCSRHAQAQSPWSVTASGGITLMGSSSSFTTIPGIPVPPSREPLRYSGQGTWSARPSFAIAGDMRLFGDLHGGLRLGYAGSTATTAAPERIPIATEQGVYLATLQHKLVTSFTWFSAEPYVRYEPLRWLGLEFAVPVTFLTGSTYTQTQRFSDPDGLQFTDGSVEQRTGEGGVPNARTTIPMISLGAEGMFPLVADSTLLIVPSMSYAFALSDVVDNTSLRFSGLRLGVGIRYRAPGPVPRRDTVRITDIVRDTTVVLSRDVKTITTQFADRTVEQFVIGDTIRTLVKEQYRRLVPKPPTVLRASVQVAFVSAKGVVSDDAQVRTHRVRRTRIIPVIPAVAFDEDSVTVLPDRYVRLNKRSAARWKEETAIRIGSGSHWQYQVLNVVGSRLLASGGSMQLDAYDDGTAEGRRNAMRRCETVRDYLTTTFGIPARRIPISVRRGQSSQQPWVLMSDTSETLFRPLTVVDTTSETQLPKVRVSPDVVSEAGVASWSIRMMQQQGRQVRVFDGKGDLPDSIDWDMNQDLDARVAMRDMTLVELFVTDKEGSSVRSAPGRIGLRNASVTDISLDIVEEQLEVLKLVVPPYLMVPETSTPSTTAWTRVEEYPPGSSEQADVWFRSGLAAAERDFYRHAEVYVKEERRP